MILCFDIGGSRIKAALSQDGVVTVLGEVPTPTTDFAAFAAALAGFLRGGEAGIAISIPGAVDPATGRSNIANIPCLNGRDLRADLSASIGLPVLVLNDADAFAMAEARMGAGRGYSCVFGIILGTGVGGGLVRDGQLVTGAGGYAGEWGHGPVIQTPALACGCGQTGCVDTIGGARGVERLHHHLTGEVATSRDILRRWHAGEEATVERWLDLVAGPLAMVINVIGADIVPAGGGLANDVRLIAALDTAVRARILRAMDRALVVPAQVSADAGLVGAAAAGEAAFGHSA
jgi:N-acetylglucosamine kinase